MYLKLPKPLIVLTLASYDDDSRENAGRGDKGDTDNDDRHGNYSNEHKSFE